jgi:aquaporin Z
VPTRNGPPNSSVLSAHARRLRQRGAGGAGFPGTGIGFAGVALAFGLTVVTGAYALGPISGGHFNPAVSIGLAAAGRFKASQLAGYIVAQVLGAIAAAGVLYLIATGKPGADIGGFATNGYGEHSPGKYGLAAALLCEVVMTAVFLIVILGSTAKRAAGGFAGLAIGLCLTLIHLVSIPVTNTSVNPAAAQARPCSGRPMRCRNSGSSGWRPSRAR